MEAPYATVGGALEVAGSGDTISVGPGLYEGVITLRGSFDPPVRVFSRVPYMARLRYPGTVVKGFYGQGITLSGFDIAHSGAGSGGLVIQIQDLLDDAGTGERVERIVIEDNVIHDSYNNDLLKINNGARQVLVRGNVFYNQFGTDEHIDVNSVTDVEITGNIFFNDFEGSGRTNPGDTHSYIVIKDSNGDVDSILGSQRITVRGNVFLHWQGSTGSCFVQVGEDGTANFEAIDVSVTSNLFLGDSPSVLRAAFGVMGSKDVTFAGNTVSGDLPALAYAMRVYAYGENQPCENINFHANIYSDPTGTMGAGSSGGNDFSDTPPGETASFAIDGNLYYNGSNPIPTDPGETINYTDDPNPTLADPLLPTPSSITLPRWNPATQTFADGSTTITQAFTTLVRLYGTPPLTSPAIGAANPTHAPTTGILGHPRGPTPDLGAVQHNTHVPAWLLLL